MAILVTHLPAGRREKRYVLEEIPERFERNRIYDESELNKIIAEVYDDFCTVRREFIAEKMMTRSGGKYRLVSGYRPIPQ